MKGIGPETADSILLYALNKPTFVVDTYTFRILSRHQLLPEACPYEELRRLFMDHLAADLGLYQEYHALLVRVGKEFCRPQPGASPVCWRVGRKSFEFRVSKIFPTPGRKKLPFINIWNGNCI